MADVGRLSRLSFAAARGSEKQPMLLVGYTIAGTPEFRRNAGIDWVL